MTDSETLTALTTAFSAAGINTPEEVAAFVNIASKQVQLNSLGVELQRLQQQAAAQQVSAQAAVEAKRSEITATEAELLALVAAQ